MASARRLFLTLGLGFLLALGGGSVRADGEETVVTIDVDVIHITQKPGKIDPGAEELHRYLKDQFRYGSMRVIRHERLRLKRDDVGRVELPNGRDVRLRPMDLDPKSGVLIAVDVERLMKADLRVKRGRKAVFGAHPYQDGKLVISIEPDF